MELLTLTCWLLPKFKIPLLVTAPVPKGCVRGAIARWHNLKRTGACDRSTAAVRGTGTGKCKSAAGHTQARGAAAVVE